MTVQAARPSVAITLGDPAGVGPELAARLLADPSNRQKADIYVLASRAEVEAAAKVVGLTIPISDSPSSSSVAVLDDGTEPSSSIKRGEVSKEAGERCIHQLQRALQMAREGRVGAILFTPLNKTSMHLGGMHEEDELRWFAKELGHTGVTSEINIIDGLWTARVTSHVGIKDVASRITSSAVTDAITLLHTLLHESGIARPRLGVCALNPHNGENGLFGREEIDEIRPGVANAQKHGIDVQGPFPSDTIWLSRNKYDGIVTMYHDQGQIAIKLLGFDGGVTVQGGLPVVIATPAHGTAFDIAGKGIASVKSSQRALDVAIAIAATRVKAKAEQPSTKIVNGINSNGVHHVVPEISVR